MKQQRHIDEEDKHEEIKMGEFVLQISTVFFKTKVSVLRTNSSYGYNISNQVNNSPAMEKISIVFLLLLSLCHR